MGSLHRGNHDFGAIFVATADSCQRYQDEATLTKRICFDLLLTAYVGSGRALSCEGIGGSRVRANFGQGRTQLVDCQTQTALTGLCLVVIAVLVCSCPSRPPWRFGTRSLSVNAIHMLHRQAVILSGVVPWVSWNRARCYQIPFGILRLLNLFGMSGTSRPHRRLGNVCLPGIRCDQLGRARGPAKQHLYSNSHDAHFAHSGPRRRRGSSWPTMQHETGRRTNSAQFRPLNGQGRARPIRGFVGLGDPLSGPFSSVASLGALAYRQTNRIQSFIGFGSRCL